MFQTNYFLNVFSAVTARYFTWGWNLE